MKCYQCELATEKNKSINISPHDDTPCQHTRTHTHFDEGTTPLTTNQTSVPFITTSVNGCGQCLQAIALSLSQLPQGETN